MVAFLLEGPLLDQQPGILLAVDIREMGSLGIIVDSAEEIVSTDDVIKIKNILELEFDLVSMKVIDEKNKHIGKIIGYTIESSSLIIQQIKVKRPVLRSLGDTELLIHRTQISKITNDTITVKTTSIPSHQPTADQALPTLDNPFRKQPQPNTIDQS